MQPSGAGDVSFAGQIQPNQQMQQRRFARAVGTDERNTGTLWNLYCDAAEDFVGSKKLT
jgi:hypothetical protein